MPYLKLPEYYSQLASKARYNVYLFAGEETYLQEEALGRLVKVLGVDPVNKEIYYGGETAIDTILVGFQTMPLLSDHRLLLVKDAQKIRAHDIQEIAEFIKVPQETSTLVFLWNERVRKDSRKNILFSSVEKAGAVVEVKALYENEMPSWIQQRTKQLGKKIDLEAAQLLVQESGSNLLDVSNELEKLDLYTGSRKEISFNDVETISGHTKLANLNHLSDAIEARNCTKALKVMESLLIEGEVSLRVLATIYRVVRRLMTAKSLIEEKKSSYQEIRQELNLNPYFDRNFNTNLARFSLSDLERGIDFILQADIDLKSSERPEAVIFEELIISLCGKRANKL